MVMTPAIRNDESEAGMMDEKYQPKCILGGVVLGEGVRMEGSVLMQTVTLSCSGLR